MNIKYPPNKKYLRKPIGSTGGLSGFIDFTDKNVLKALGTDELSYLTAMKMISLNFDFVSSDISEFPEFQFFGVKALTGPNVFTNSAQLTSIIIPASVEYIGPDAFKGCTNLASVKLLGKTDIDPHAFDDCPNVIIIGQDGIGYQRIGIDLKIY